MFNKSHKIKVSKEVLGQRIDNFLINYLKGIPRSKIYSIIRKGEVRVNGSRKKPLYKISEGDEIRIPPLNIDEKKELFIPENFIKLLKERIVYENQNYLIINKPSGVASHGGSGIKLGLIESVRNFGKLYRDCDLKLANKPYAPTVEDLHRNGRHFPPNFLHESWMDYLYWDIELEP